MLIHRFHIFQMNRGNSRLIWTFAIWTFTFCFLHLSLFGVCGAFPFYCCFIQWTDFDNLWFLLQVQCSKVLSDQACLSWFQGRISKGKGICTRDWITPSSFALNTCKSSFTYIECGSVSISSPWKWLFATIYTYRVKHMVIFPISFKFIVWECQHLHFKWKHKIAGERGRLEKSTLKRYSERMKDLANLSSS